MSIGECWLKIDGLNTQALIKEYYHWRRKDNPASNGPSYNANSGTQLQGEAKTKVSAYREFLHKFRGVGRALAAQANFFKY